MMTVAWGYLERELKKLYEEWGIADHFNDNIEYLKDASERIEEIWYNQLSSINKIKYVMISEAPIWGSQENYFYNSKIRFTPFFWFEDITAFSEEYSDDNLNNLEDKKNYVFQKLQEEGFILFDLFPFAFNENNTRINYRNLFKSQYKQLLEISYYGYIDLKMQSIKKKSHRNIRFFYRYKLLKEKTDDFIHRKLVENQLVDANEDIISIGGINMSLDRDMLRRIIQQGFVRRKNVGLKFAGYETPEGQERIIKAYDDLMTGYQRSHRSLIELTDFLNDSFIDNFLNPLLGKYLKITDKRHIEFINKSMKEFRDILEKSTKVRQKTSNLNEEFTRALADFPPRKDGDYRIFCE